MKNHEYFDPDNPGSGSELPPDGDYTGELAENPQQEEYSLPEDVDQIVEWAEKEGNPLYPVPVIWSRQEFKEFILSVREENE